MGVISTVVVADNGDLQRSLNEAIENAQSTDPLATVTLVVDSAAQAWGLRRQIAEARAPGSGLANIKVATLIDVMSGLVRPIGLQDPSCADPLLSAAVVGSLLRIETGPLSASADHPDTALLLASLAEELAWCPLDDVTRALNEAGSSLTSGAAINFVAQSRGAMGRDLAISAWPEVSRAILTRLTAAPNLALDLGAVVILASRLPAPARQVFETLADLISVNRIRVVPPDEPVSAQVLDFPDPATEVSFAVRCAADALARGSNPGRVAILYSTDIPYARLLERGLEQAGIAWHGPTGQSLRSSTVARCLFVLTELATERSAQGSGITRPLLMRLLGLGHLSRGPAPVSTGPSRALIRQEGLFGDALSWLRHLNAIATPDENLEGEIQSDDARVGEPELPERRHAQRLAAHAGPLATFITALDGALGRIQSATTWADLGTGLWAALETFHLQGTWWGIRPEDAATVEAVKMLLLSGFPSIDTLASHAPAPSAADAAEMLDRILSARRARHGESSIGVHVGPISSSRTLVFDNVILVGSSEGLLPPVRGENPLLTDSTRLHLRLDPDDLPTSSELEIATARDVRAVARAARSCTALLSRGALPGRAIGLPSRYLPAGKPERVASIRDVLTREPAPLASADIAELAAMASDHPDPSLLPIIASLAAWARPERGPYFGDVGGSGARWTLHNLDISASSIEQFLHCPYHFFVQRILRFSTDQFEDTVDTIAPNDMGILLHTAFERFIKDSKKEGTLPGAGQAWPDSALPALRSYVDAEVEGAIGKGLTGWRPAWERSYAIVVASLPEFLVVDALEVRGNPATMPIAAEQGFGFEGDPVVEFKVSDSVVVRLRGLIDRVDASADGSSVGIVDYKSHLAKGFADKLGKPKRDATPRERQKVQDLIYDSAARVLYPEADRIDVHFLFVPNGGNRPEVVTPSHDLDRAEVLREILGRLEAAGRTGSFPPTPQGWRDYCPVCTRLGRRARVVSGRAAMAEQVDPS